MDIDGLNRHEQLRLEFENNVKAKLKPAVVVILVSIETIWARIV